MHTHEHLTPAHPENPQISLPARFDMTWLFTEYETTLKHETLFGEEAQACADAVSARHHLQRYQYIPGVKPISLPNIETVQISCTPITNTVRLGSQSFPVTIADHNYWMRDAAGGEYLFCDHTHSLLPTDALYQALAQVPESESTAEQVLVQLMDQFSRTEPGAAQEEMLKSHQAMATKHGVLLDIERMKRCFEQYQVSNAPLHCYLAGTTDPYLIHAAISRFVHLTHNQVSETELQHRFLQQLQTEAGVMQLLHLDVLPFESMSALSFKILVCRSLVRQLQGEQCAETHTNDTVRLPSVSPENCVRFLITVAAQVGQNISDDEVCALEYKEKTFEVAASKGLVTGLLELGITDYPTLQKIQQIAHTIGIRLNDEILSVGRVYEHLLVPQTLTEQCVSPEAVEWLDLAHVASRVSGIVDSSLIRDPDVVAILSQNSSITNRYEADEVAPEYPQVRTVFDKRGSNLELQSYFWRLLTEEKLEVVETTPEEFMRFLGEVRDLFSSSFFLRQIDQRVQHQVFAFFEWFTELVQSSIKNENGLSFTFHLKSILKKVREYLKSGQLTSVQETLNLWVGQAWFTRSCQVVNAEVQKLGYPMVWKEPQPEPQSAETTRHVTIGSDYVPYHLVVEQAHWYRRTVAEIRGHLNNRLDFNTGSETANSNKQHFGVRIAHVIKEEQTTPGAEIVCQGHFWNEVEKSSSKMTWNLTPRTRKLISTWRDQAGDDPSLIEQMKADLSHQPHQFESMKDSSILQIATGHAYLHWVRQEVFKRLDQIEKNTDHQSKALLLEEVHQLLYSLHEIEHIWVLTFLCKAGFMFDHIVRLYQLTTALGKPFSEERVVPPGEMSIAPSEMLFVLGANMAGKSTAMRALAHAVILENQGLPQPGTAQVPAAIRLDTAVGLERQRSGESLLSSLVRGLNKLRDATPDQTLWMFDELGRRTNSRYGITFTLVAAIASLSDGTRGNMSVAASHYHSLPKYAELLTAVGIQPKFMVSENYRVRALQPAESTDSNVVQVLARYVPKDWLSHWSDPNWQQKTEFSGLESDAVRETSLARIAAITRRDLFGTDAERIRNVSHLLGSFDEQLATAFLRIFSDPTKGQENQRVLADMYAHLQPEDQTTLTYISRIISHLEKSRRERMPERKETFLRLCCSLFNIEADQVDTSSQIKQKLEQLHQRYRQLLEKFSQIFAQNSSQLINFTQLDIDVSSLTYTSSIPTQQTAQLDQLRAVCSFAELVHQSDAGFCKVQFTEQAELAVEGMWNPLLRENRAVQQLNRVQISFDDTQVGTFVSGENFAGKSNYMRATSLLTWLALCTGFGPAESVLINPNVLPVSLTQPVSDSIGTSSMAAEVKERFITVIQAAQQLSDKCILTFLDEPGAPTSPEDAARCINWLYRLYQETPHAHLMITSHCDQVPDLLQSQGIAVEYLAFQLLSEHPFQAFSGTADSNALAVARELGLDESLFEVAELVYRYVLAVDAGADAASLAQELGPKITAIVAKWQTAKTN